MSVPTISRARDLICTRGRLVAVDAVDASTTPSPSRSRRAMPPARWMTRPDPEPHPAMDPRRGRPTTCCSPAGPTGGSPTATPPRTRRRSRGCRPPMSPIDADGTRPPSRPADSTRPTSWSSCHRLDGLLYTGWRTISSPTNLDTAAERFSTAEIPAGWLEQTDNSEPMTPTNSPRSPTDFADRPRCTHRRRVEPVPPVARVDHGPVPAAAGRGPPVSGRRTGPAVANIPPIYVNAPVGTGMTYTNTAQAKQDLIDFGALPYIAAIEQTFGGPNVTPNGQAVRLDVNAWLRNPYVPNDNASPNDAEIALNPSAAPTSRTSAEVPADRATSTDSRIEQHMINATFTPPPSSSARPTASTRVTHDPRASLFRGT